jgi:hypothetical protein
MLDFMVADASSANSQGPRIRITMIGTVSQ